MVDGVLVGNEGGSCDGEEGGRGEGGVLWLGGDNGDGVQDLAKRMGLFGIWVSH